MSYLPEKRLGDVKWSGIYPKRDTNPGDTGTLVGKLVILIKRIKYINFSNFKSNAIIKEKRVQLGGFS